MSKGYARSLSKTQRDNRVFVNPLDHLVEVLHIHNFEHEVSAKRVEFRRRLKIGSPPDSILYEIAYAVRDTPSKGWYIRYEYRLGTSTPITCSEAAPTLFSAYIDQTTFIRAYRNGKINLGPYKTPLPRSYNNVQY